MMHGMAPNPTHLVNVDVSKGALGLITRAAPRDPAGLLPLHPNMPVGLMHHSLIYILLPAGMRHNLITRATRKTSDVRKAACPQKSPFGDTHTFSVTEQKVNNYWQPHPHLRYANGSPRHRRTCS